MLVKAIKGTYLITLLNSEGTSATIVEGDSLDIDPKGWSVIAENQENQAFFLLVKVLRDEDPRYVVLHLKEGVYDQSKEETFWIESSDNKRPIQ